MYIDLLHLGLFLLLIYGLYDWRSGRSKPLLRRILFYSFLVYGLFVVHYTLGGIIFGAWGPHRPTGIVDIQSRPFQFLDYTLHLYRTWGPDGRVLESLRLSFYNLLLLMPLGFYLPVLFGRKTVVNVVFIALVVSLTIETTQLVLTYGGLIRARTFNVDDLILNTAGAWLGWQISRLFLGRWMDREEPRGGSKSDGKF